MTPDEIDVAQQAAPPPPGPPPVKPMVPALRAGQGVAGIIPATFDECWRLAQMVQQSSSVPKGHDGTAEGMCMIILYGLEIGIPPMQAIQCITKINGKFCVYGDMIPAMLLSRGFDIEQSFEGTPYEDSFKAVCAITRPNGKVITRSFSVAEAKYAQLWNTNVWKTFPQRMLGWRALGFAKTDGAADVFRGMGIAEVERDIQLVDATDSPLTPPRAALAPPPPPKLPVPQLVGAAK